MILYTFATVRYSTSYHNKAICRRILSYMPSSEGIFIDYSECTADCIATPHSNLVRERHTLKERTDPSVHSISFQQIPSAITFQHLHLLNGYLVEFQ